MESRPYEFLLHYNQDESESASHSVVSDSLWPMDCSPPGFSVHGIVQARILEWAALAFSRGSSQPRAWTQVSHHSRQILYHLSHQGSPWSYLIGVGLKPKVIGICIRRRKFGTTKAHRECHMKTEAETGVIYKPEKTKNCQQPQESRRETWNRSVLCNFRGNKVLLTTWFYPSSLQNQETIHFSCFKPLNFG